MPVNLDTLARRLGLLQQMYVGELMTPQTLQAYQHKMQQTVQQTIRQDNTINIIDQNGNAHITFLKRADINVQGTEIQTKLEFQEMPDNYTHTTTNYPTIWYTNSVTTSTATTIPINGPVWTTSNLFIRPPTFSQLPDPRNIFTPFLSAEERQKREEEERAYWEAVEEQRKKEAAIKALANEKAEKLLDTCLNNTQRQDLKVKGFFHLYVGEKKYRIKRGFAGNIELVNERGDAQHKYCIHPKERVPDADAMLAQKFLLETNEAEFLRIANRHF